MKRLIAIALAVIMVLGLVACGSINKTEVAVLWSGDGVVKVPNSLINAMERAMYIKSIAYAHYGANEDQAQQTKQAETALNAGCAALAVELVDPAAAQIIVDMAKAKNVPVVFFNCDVDEAVVKSYAKCALITSDTDTLTSVYSTMVNDYLAENVELEKEPVDDDLDLDDDRKITYLALGEVKLEAGEVETVAVNAALEDLTVRVDKVEKPIFFGLFGTSVVEYGRLVTADGTVIEMILMDDDVKTLDALVALQEKGMNADKLATNFVPVFTVGADADYKAHILAELPTDAEARLAYLESAMVFVDLTGISQEEWTKWENKEEKNEVDTMIYNTFNQVDAGKLTNTAIEDDDSIAIATATVLRNLLKDNEIMKDVADIKEGITVDGQKVSIPYTTYAG